MTKSGIVPEKIINAGYLLDKWSSKQYFDLDVLEPSEEEVFVDIGALDGMTTIGFSNWCIRNGQKFVYVFEPDSGN